MRSQLSDDGSDDSPDEEDNGDADNNERVHSEVVRPIPRRRVLSLVSKNGKGPPIKKIRQASTSPLRKLGEPRGKIMEGGFRYGDKDKDISNHRVWNQRLLNHVFARDEAGGGIIAKICPTPRQFRGASSSAFQKEVVHGV